MSVGAAIVLRATRVLIIVLLLMTREDPTSNYLRKNLHISVLNIAYRGDGKRR
jgi:hypothetical protein